MSDRAQFAVEVMCGGCGRPGSITWEEQAVADRRQGLMRTLVRVSEGFNHHPGDNNSGDPTITCAHCGTTQQD